MLIEVSIGELVDKISILELKQKYIKNPQKKQEASKEFNTLLKHSSYVSNQFFFYSLLYYINEQIWVLTENVKKFGDFDKLTDETLKKYASITNDIFTLNQKRYRLKKIFDMIYASNVKEQKSYNETYCKIIIKDEEELLDKIAEINYLLSEYDYVLFEAPCIKKIQDIFKWPTIIDEKILKNVGGKITHTIHLFNYNIQDNKIRKKYEFLPIKYVASGTLGDFIHQLSIINENFYKTGTKGYLYITDYFCMFNWGSVKTYHDTYEIISKQRYIHTYSMYSRQRFMQSIFCTETPDSFDINLSSWRSDPQFFNSNPWSKTFEKSYNIEWGKHKWLDVPYDSKWKNCVLINTIDYRGTIENIDFLKVFEKYNKTHKILFICNSEKHYNHFLSTYKIKIDCRYLSNFTEICTAIRSCDLFVGALSLFLSIAHAVHDVPHLIGLNESYEDKIRVSDLDKIVPAAKFSLNEIKLK
jgi:hypothetical protein